MVRPIDEWGKGKAFRCAAADCGVDVILFVRAKIGFCNCKTGVSDDDELNRLSDFGLMGEKPSVLGPGRPIDVAWMKGRSRAYAIADPYRAGARRWRLPSTTTAMPSLPRPWSPTKTQRRSNPALSISSTARPSCTGPSSRLVCSDRRLVLFQGKDKDLAGIDTIRISDSVPVRPINERIPSALAIGQTADAP